MLPDVLTPRAAENAAVFAAILGFCWAFACCLARRLDAWLFTPRPKRAKDA